MDPIGRRTFLQTATATTTSAVLASGPIAASGADRGSKRWKKAFMLGNLRNGSPLGTFRLLREAGFEGVELMSPSKLDRRAVVEARDQTGLTIHGVCGSRHWDDTLSDPDPKVVERGLAALRQGCEDCRAYGGTTVLVVPAVVSKKVGYRDAYKRSQANIHKLIPTAQQHGVKIAIEEVWNRFLLSPIEFARYIDEFDSPWVGAYFDVGNVVEFGYPEEWIRELGKRILKVHIKEYAKPRRFDYGLGEGNEIDWAAVREALVSVGYDGWVTAEVGYGTLEQMKDVVARMDRLLHGT